MWRTVKPVGAELLVALKRMVFYLLKKKRKKMGLKFMLNLVEKQRHRSASAGGALNLPERPAGFGLQAGCPLKKD